MGNLLEVSHLNNIFIAKGNVKHMSGGPVMSLVGFIHPGAIDEFKVINEELSRSQLGFVAQKIIIEAGKGIGFYPGVSSSVFYGGLWWDIPAKKPTGWHHENTYTSKFLCLTRYYDDSVKKFTYKIFSPLELELVQ